MLVLGLLYDELMTGMVSMPDETHERTWTNWGESNVEAPADGDHFRGRSYVHINHWAMLGS